MNGRESFSYVCLGYEGEQADNVIHKFGSLISHHISYHQQNIRREHMEELDMDRKTLLNWIL
jgi:hypothetical protein